jgi:hypothetical protein
MKCRVTIGEIQTLPASVASLEAIQALQIAVLASDLPLIDIPLEHAFADGLYRRLMRMRAGDLVIGKLHRTNHFGVLMRGVVDVWEPGGAKTRIIAPALLTTKAGTKRVIHALADVEWVTFHATEHTDPEMIERDIIDPETELLEKMP